MRRFVGILLLVVAVALSACAPTAAPAAEAPAAAATEAPAAEAPAAEATEAPAAEAAAGGEMVMLPEVNPLEVTGDVVTAGSSTVFPLSEAMAARFIDEGYAGTITVESIGTGAGFERFCTAGETDISNASRGIDEEETAGCQAIGREPVEFRVGTDALAVVVNPGNEFLTDVTVEQLALIFSDEVTMWSEVDPAWPAEAILRFSPGTDSGTFDYFVEAVMEEAYGDEGNAKILNAANLQLSEDDNILVQGVEGDTNAIGYFGYAYAEEAGDLVKILNINGVEPTAEAVEAGDYALARPLFIYSAPTIMQEKAQVASFINFYLTYVNEEIEAAGYFPASDEALNASKQAWMAAVGE